MSSSVFIESSSVPKSAAEKEAALASSADANLVVVYGKNGINFDRKGLENLIEEKTLSSISVIRLTSPTPSMEMEEEEAEKLADIGSDEESEVDGEKDSADEDDVQDKNIETDYSNLSAEEDDGVSAEEYEDTTNADSRTGESLKHKRGAKNKAKSTKLQRLRRKQRKERPEIVGLTVEEFYTAEDANAVLKEALRKAGVSTIKHTAEYEFQLYVIKNDHCYTPFTSPEQMKLKIAAGKAEAEKQTPTSRKALPQVGVTTKHFVGKKKQPHVEEWRKTTDIKSGPDEKEKRAIRDKQQRPNESDELIDYDEDIHTSAAEDEEDAEDDNGEDDESEFFESEESAETDNDRDSDLDFDINNRKGRKRKVKLLKRTKRGMAGKAQQRRYKHSQDDSEDGTPATSVSRTKGFRSTSSDAGRPVTQKIAFATTVSKGLLTTTTTVTKSSTTTAAAIAKSTPTTVTAVTKGSSTTVTSAAEAIQLPRALAEAGAVLPPIPKKQTTVSAVEMPSPQPVSPLVTAVRRGPVVQVGGAASRTSKIHSSPQTVKEIVINKVIASPKCGFTNIGTLLTLSDNSVPIAPTTPTSSTRPPNKNAPSSKGFMPLGIDAAAKNQLPAQISIQMHQSSSELAAEHDKQLDLIDSIVKNEMEKCGVMEQAASVNENIPELVEMLESTAKALESHKMPPVNNNYTERTTTNDEDIDISHAPLLGTPEDDIPDDFLQHVVQLMEDDKTLQEEVEKQVFGDDSSEAVTSVLSTTTTPPPLAPIMKLTTNTAIGITSQQTPQAPVQPMKSIIQMAISNAITDSSSISPTTSSGQSRVPGIHTPKTAPLVRKEPIQIVRGNGRVITLPPIEAPTTRAKRRAQTQPAHHNFATATFNESSLDSSLQSNSSFTAAANSDVSISAEKKPVETTTKRRISKENITLTPNSSKPARKSSTRKPTGGKSGATTNKGENTEASESQGDDDDPNKLWCVCRQPHNNRFMICCDVCEDWFHGTCVNITKAMGLEMEQKSIDWTCPKCVKKQEEKKQRKITDMLVKKPPVVEAENDSLNVSQDVQQEVAATITQNPPNATAEIPTTTPVLNVLEAPPKKQLIEIKKIQSGQFISLKNLEQAKKSPVAAGISPSVGSKKLFAPAQHPKAVSGGTLPSAQVKRVVVVQNVHHKAKPAAAAPASAGAALATGTENPPTPCIVCKKLSRANSIYCSDDCIRKHAQNALQAFQAKPADPSALSPQPKGTQDDKKKKAKGLFEDLLLMADRKPRIERVHVFERKSGRVLTGHNAPTTANLKKWLQDNPTFEVVQPGSVQALEIEKKHKQRGVLSSSPTASNKSYTMPLLDASHQQSISPSSVQQPQGKSSPAKSTLKADGLHVYAESTTPLLKSVKQLQSSSSGRPATPKQLSKYPQQVSIRSDRVHKPDAMVEAKAKEKTLKRQSSENVSKKHTEATVATTDSEPIRLNVKRTLKEQLQLRISELPTNEAKLSPEEVDQFVTATEGEMYLYFNRDTGHKYKAKYRSLMFNIKDRKNHTLFAKICAKQIEAKQLVHMSPEELASQELAQWRENEAKHQLEMIKKSELDMLSCAKNYVLKTHKGEEVIEDTLTDRVNLDLTIPVEDVVSVLNNSMGGGNNDGLDELGTSAASTGASYDYTHSATTLHHYHTENIDKTPSHKEKEKERTQESEKRHKSKDRHRDKSRSRKRSRSRSRSRSHSRGKDKHHKKNDREERTDHHSHSRSRSRSHSKETRHKTSHRDERRGRDERGRHHSNSHSRSRSHSKEKRHKSSHKEEHRDREERSERSERGTDKERGRERAKEREHKDDADRKSLEKKLPTYSSASSSTSSKSYHSHALKEAKKKSNTQKPLESFSLIDQILESTKTVEEAANLVATEKDDQKARPTTPPTTSATSVSTSAAAAAPALAAALPQYEFNPVVTATSSKKDLRNAEDAVDYDQEPTSTVSIATPPHDPYLRYSGADSPSSSSSSITLLPPSNTIWGGTINMIDVASFQIILQAVVGNAVNLGKLLPTELDVVGRIGPDTVWDYISKIKKSPNKEIVIVRLLPANEAETSAYTILYQYLDKRKRLGVIKTTSAQIKDFYIYPLGAGMRMPPILQPIEQVEFYEDAQRPDMLVGVVIRVIGKRNTVASTPAFGAMTATASNPVKFPRITNSDGDSFTPPGSPKRRKTIHSVMSKAEEYDIDAIIKGPITAKIQKTTTVTMQSGSMTTAMDDADEPYSPGGSSDEDTPLLPLKSSTALLDTHKAPDDELKRKMDELNRQIAAQEMEIAGLLNVEPSRFAASPSTTSKVLANISIPSNLSQILASIKSKPEASQPPPPPQIGSLITQDKADNDDEEYNPEEAITSISYESTGHATEKSASGSRLAQLSEAELLSMVPDNMIEETSTSALQAPAAGERTSHFEEEPPPPGV